MSLNDSCPATRALGARTEQFHTTIKWPRDTEHEEDVKTRIVTR
jgi:hypothetical protein